MTAGGLPPRLPAKARRAARRFAEVVCPPGMTAHHRTERVLEELELMMAALAPEARRALTVTLVVLDQAARMYPRSRGRRFTRLDDQAGEAYIRALLASRSVPAEFVRRLKSLVVMCYYELPQVQREIGYRPAPYIAAVSRRRLASYGPEIRAGEAAVTARTGNSGAEQGRADQISEVGRGRGEVGGGQGEGWGRTGQGSRPAGRGSGPAGRGSGPAGRGSRPAGRGAVSIPEGLTTQADITGELSLECGVVIVGSGAGGATVAAELAEAGVDVVVLEEGGYHPTESFRPETGRALRTLYRDGGGGATIGRPSVLFAEGRCVGGSTVVNGGMSWRTPAGVLERWAKQDGVLEISEAEMAPYFATFETRNSVGTQDPETIGRNSLLLKAGADAKGWAILENRRNQLHCAGTSNCSNGCPTGAKRSMAVTSVPRALAFGARVIADCRVDRVIRSGRTVTGVTGHVVRPGGAQGPRVTVRAKAVIAAGGSIQTPALLLRSGLRSASGQLGRNLSLHPNANVVAFFDSDVTGWQGVHQAFQIREFLAEGIMMSAQNLTPSMLAGVMPGYGRGLGEMMADYNRVVTAGPLIEDTGTGRVRNVPGLGTQVFYRVTDKDAARVVRGVELTAEALFAAGARRVVLPFNGAPDVRDASDLRRLLAEPVPRRSIELYSIHLMGTARMSEDPRRGVVDSYGAFHGVRGLFVCDASVFPSPIGINPMETVIALAMRNARRLIEQRGRYAL